MRVVESALSAGGTWKRTRNRSGSTRTFALSTSLTRHLNIEQHVTLDPCDPDNSCTPYLPPPGVVQAGYRLLFVSLRSAVKW